MTDKLTAADLMSRAWSEDTRQRRATLLEAVELADADNDLDLGFSARRAYVNACHATPNPLMMIAHYGWCLARHDEDPERFPISLWNYKWVANAAPLFAGVSREQLTELVDDLRRRFEAKGSPGPAGVALCDINASLGDLDELATNLDVWRNSPKGALNDCRACDISSEVYYLGVLGRHQEAIDAAAPLIDRSQACASQPHYAFANLLDGARAVGDTELAGQLSVQGLDLIRRDPDFVEVFGDHLRHFAVTGQLDEGLELLRTMLPLVEGADSRMLSFYRGARLVLQLADDRDRDDVADLHEAVDGKAEELAAGFDERNGNTHRSDRLAADLVELHPESMSGS